MVGEELCSQRNQTRPFYMSIIFKRCVYPESPKDRLPTTEQDQIALKMVLPEKPTCLALDQKARYCACGTAQGRIYLWEARFLSSFPVCPRPMTLLIVGRVGHTLQLLGCSLSPSERVEIHLRRNSIGICQRRFWCQRLVSVEVRVDFLGVKGPVN